MTNGNAMDIDKLRLIITSIIAVGTLAGATFLTLAGKLDSAACVALYGASIGAIGTGVRGSSGPIMHTHHINGGDTTGPAQK